jgi:hypothetical protein
MTTEFIAFTPVSPVPFEPPAMVRHGEHGASVARKVVRDADSEPLFAVYRFNTAAGGKVIYPQSYGTRNGRTDWHWHRPAHYERDAARLAQEMGEAEIGAGEGYDPPPPLPETHEEAIRRYGSVLLYRAIDWTRWHIERAELRKNRMPSDSEGIDALWALGGTLDEIQGLWSAPANAEWFKGCPGSIDNPEHPERLLMEAWRAARNESERDIHRRQDHNVAESPLGQAIEVESGALSPLIHAFRGILDCLWQVDEGYMTLIEARIAAAEILAYAPGDPPMSAERQKEILSWH